ncbi:MAG: TonB-dependent receptor [Acidobacteriota bacterium]
MRLVTTAVLLVVGLIATPVRGQEVPSRQVRGLVIDQGGVAVADAIVTVSAGGQLVQVRTNHSGAFAVTVPFSPVIVFSVSSEGSTVGRDIPFEKIGDPLLFRIPALQEAITVTANRSASPLSDTPASVSIISRSDIETSAGTTTDGLLRRVPGFTLFRRTDSTVAHPTSQGVSLRGVGASGAGRALVLEDGVPLNDPFGGWVYWGRVPRSAIERIEVLRGGASDLYGSSALGGVIQLVRRDGQVPALDTEISAGSQKTSSGSFFAAMPLAGVQTTLSAERFATGGYFLVGEDARGFVDRPASSAHTAADITVKAPFVPGEAFARFSFYRESRTNGTKLQVNDSTIRQFTMGGDWNTATTATSVRSFVENQDFDSTFTSVGARRDSERLTRVQSVPADSWGASAQRSFSLRGTHLFLMGADARNVRGRSNETVLSGSASTPAVGGGTQRTIGIFVEDSAQFGSRLSVSAGGRFDSWQNYHSLIVSGTNERRPPAKMETAFSPRMSLLYRLPNQVAIAASAYEAFRAPTLNELYRGFRVGNIETLPNEDLLAERATGGEAGINVVRGNGTLSGRGRLFWTEVEDTIANATISSTPSLITRQRRNLGRTRSRGLEMDLDIHPLALWTVSSGFLFTDAIVRKFPENTALEGLRLPQIPRMQWTAAVLYAGPKVRFALDGRYSASQFDDDENALPLDSYLVVDLFVSRRLPKFLELFVTAENLSGDRYEVGRTPLLTIGPPRLLRAGIRWSARK